MVWDFMLPNAQAAMAPVQPPRASQPYTPFDPTLPVENFPVNQLAMNAPRTPASLPQSTKSLNNAIRKESSQEKQAMSEYEKLQKQLADYMKKREEIAIDTEARMAKLDASNAAKGPDLSMLMSFADKMAQGSTMAGGPSLVSMYQQSGQRPMSPEELELLKNKLQGQAAQQYGGLSDDVYKQIYGIEQKEMAKNAAASRLGIAQLKAKGKDELGRQLGSDDIKRLGYITSMQSNLRDGLGVIDTQGLNPIHTITALKSGLVEDNPLAIALRNAAESYGRMQSGGAINKEEERRFLDSLFKVGDTPDIVRRKLKGKLSEVADRESQLYYGKDWRDFRKPLDFEKSSTRSYGFTQEQIDEEKRKRGLL